MSDIVQRLRDSCSSVNSNLLTTAADEITRLRTLLSEAQQRGKDARAKALEEAAKVVILTANQLTTLPPSVRKSPEVGGIMASRILELRSPVEGKINEVVG